MGNQEDIEKNESFGCHAICIQQIKWRVDSMANFFVFRLFIYFTYQRMVAICSTFEK